MAVEVRWVVVLLGKVLFGTVRSGGVRHGS